MLTGVVQVLPERPRQRKNGQGKMAFIKSEAQECSWAHKSCRALTAIKASDEINLKIVATVRQKNGVAAADIHWRWIADGNVILIGGVGHDDLGQKGMWRRKDKA